MAGAYEACIDENKVTEFTSDLIENLGDATEALQHMFYMIQYLTNSDLTKIAEASEAATWRITDGAFYKDDTIEDPNMDFELVYEIHNGKSRMLLIIKADDYEDNIQGPWPAKEAALKIVDYLYRVSGLGFGSMKDAEHAYIFRHMRYMNVGMNDSGNLYPSHSNVIEEIMNTDKGAK